MDMLKMKGEGTWTTYEKKGHTYVRFRKTYNGERKEFSGRTKKEVLEKVKAFEQQPLTRSQRNTLKMPFSDYMKECNSYFSKKKRSLSPNTILERESLIEQIAKTPLGMEQLGCVNEDLITQYLYSQRDSYYAKSTLNKQLGFIKRCLNRAVEQKLLPENPAKEIPYFEEDEVLKATKEVKSLQLSDMMKLVEEAKRINTASHKINGEIGTPVYGVNADVIVFLLFTGLRIGEALALKWENVDLVKNQIHVESTLKEIHTPEGATKTALVCGKTKTKSSVRYVSLCPDAIQVLAKRKKANPKAQNTDFVFQTDEGTPVLRRNVTRTLKAMLVRSGCSNQDATPHVLRHTFGSYLISQGADLYSVSKLLGHSSIKMTESVYLELLNSANHKTVSLFDNLNTEVQEANGKGK